MGKQMRPSGYRRVTLVDRSVEVAQRWWPVMTFVYASAGTAYAKGREWLGAIDWLDAVVVGFVASLILTALTLWVFAAYRRLKPLTPPARDRKEFMDETVNLSDLVAHEPIIYGKTFVRCVVRGPGQIKLHSHVKHLYCSMLERNVVEVPVGSNVTGAVMVVECVFVECYFDVAIVGTPQDSAKLRQATDFVSLPEWEARYARG